MKNNRTKILQWAEAGHIGPQQIEQAILLTDSDPNQDEWLDFLKSSLLWMGIVAFCSGVIFYFAFNWQEMSRFSKFALIEVSLLISAVVMVRLSNNPRFRAASFIGMSLLTGALLALVGQTYQTGADPWQLFASWSFLILPWVLVARTTSLWIFWLLLLNLSLILFLEVHSGIFGIVLTAKKSQLIFTLLNGFLLILFELKPWLLSQFSKISNSFGGAKIVNRPVRYVNQLIASLATISITLLAIWTIFDSRASTDYFALLFYAVWAGVFLYFYRLKTRDLLILAITAISLISVSIALLFKLFEDSLDEGVLLLVSFALIGLSTTAGLWLKKIAQEFKQRSIDEQNFEELSVAEQLKSQSSTIAGKE